MIPFQNDTLVGISQKQFNTILFAFSYVRSLENTLKIDSNQLTRLDSINTLIEKELSLERSKSLYKDSIAVNLTIVIEDYKKARRREKVKKTFTYIGLGILAGAEAGIITYLLIK